MEEEDECSSRVEHSSNEVEKKLEAEEEEEHPSSNTQSLEINNDSKKQVEHLKKEEEEEEGDKFQEENEQPSANAQFEIDVQPQLDDSDKAVDGSNLVVADVVDGQEASFPATDDVLAIVAEESPFEHVPVESELQRNVGDTPPTMANEAAHSETAPFDAGDVPSMLDGEVPIGVPPVDTNDTPSVIAPVEAEHTSPVAPVYASIDSPPIDTEEAPSLIAQDTSSIVAEHTSIAPEVAPSMFTVAIPVPSVVVEDTTLVAEDTPSMVAEGAPSMVTEDTPMTVFEDAPSMAATDAPSMVAEETPSIVSKGPPSMIAEMAPPMVAEETPSIVSEGPPSMIAEMAPPMLAEDAPPIVVEEEPSVAGEDSAKVVAEEAPRVAAEDPSPGVNEDASPMDDENASPTAADAVVQVLEVDTEVETETEMVDTEMAMETEAVDTGSSGVQKRKRGRPAKAQAQAQAQAQAKAQPKGAPPSKRMEEEDVCFICFDGGNLVLCDRRACPKAYHPACINRDEAFFRSKGRWNCGWHICSNCQKAAHYMCYTCTYSLCKGCIKEAEFLCVRGNRGFCEACMRTILLIEKNEQPQIDFDDKSSWEYLFKEYWIDLKRKHSITLDELIQAKNPLKGSNTLARNGESSEELYDANDDKGSDSDGSSEHLEVSTSKKPKTRRRLKTSKVEEPPSVTHAVGKITPLSNNAEWASKELLEFVAHMKNGDKSVQTQFDVQALLLDYIKQNNLRDPRKKSQIVCDSRLESLFGKARVGHFEMLKLLELHFLIKEDTQADDNQGTTDTEANQLDGDGSAGVVTKDKRRKSRKKGDGRGPQTNLDDYAAIDVHNIKLLYLRRNLMEDLLEDSEKFHDKVVGAFVRIRISGSGQKQDMYRLVQVAGTRKAAEPYKTGKRLADVVLEILNLNKTEFISIDTISNQEFSEDECKRLRQSIKCGLISRMTVGEVQEKAMALQTVRVSDWLEMEKLRISHLRDRASEQGRRKDLRECVEKLQLLNTPEERFRRLQEIPEVHADPNMDPNYVSEEDEEQDDRSQDKSMMSRDAGFGRKGRDLISPGKGSPASVDTWSGARKSATSGSEPGRNLSTTGVWDRAYGGNGAGESVSDAHHLNNWEKPKDLASATGLGTGASSGQVVGRSGPSPGNPQEPASSLSTGISSNISETDKMWHYQDPSGKIQGPFSMQQLRKWNKTGHFPVDLRIWRTNEKQEDSVLLNDALVGKFTKELPHKSNNFSPPSGNNQELSWGGSTNPALTDRNLIDRMSNSNYIDASVFANDGAQLANSGAQLANSDVWGSGSSSWAAPATDTKKTDVWGPGSSGWAAPATESKKTDVWGGGSSGWAAPATESKKTDVWGGGSSGWAAPTTDSRGEQSGHSFRGGWDSRGNNGWAGRPVHNPQTSSSYYGQPQRPISHARGQGGGRWNHGQSRGNNWNPGRYAGQQSNTGRGGYDKRANNMGPSVQSSGERWRTPENSTKGWGTVEIPKPLTESWDVNQTSNRSNLSNLPSPTPMTSRANWTDQASENKWSPTSSVPSYPANTMPSAAPRMGSNGVPVGVTEPNKTASGWGEQQNFPITPATGGWGPSASPGTGSVPTKPAEILNQDGRVDYSSPPTPTPMSAGN